MPFASLPQVVNTVHLWTVGQDALVLWIVSVAEMSRVSCAILGTVCTFKGLHMM